MFDLSINRRVFGNWRHLLAFGFGSGLAKYAPGTFGTLVAIPIFLAIGHLPAWLYAVTVLAAFALGVWICDTVSRDLRVHDHGGIVFDEFVGFWITMFMAPITVTSVALGFVAVPAFRHLEARPDPLDRPARRGWLRHHGRRRGRRSGCVRGAARVALGLRHRSRLVRTAHSGRSPASR